MTKPAGYPDSLIGHEVYFVKGHALPDGNYVVPGSPGRVVNQVDESTYEVALDDQQTYPGIVVVPEDVIELQVDIL